MGFQICVVGLGLMGASMARALRGFRGASIVGADVRGDVCALAEQDGTVERAYTDAGEAIEGSDLVIFCVYAHHIPPIARQNGGAFKPGAVLCDICGVKSGLYAELLPLLPKNTDYVGLHPMAGKERDGFENADPAIYKNSGFIISPLPSTKPETTVLARELAVHVGAARIAEVPPEKHDEIIAYTSDLMHIAAAALCVNFHPEMTLAFTAGAFRDCTRIADINAGAWTELLLSNRKHTADCLDKYIESLEKIRLALGRNDAAGLHALLERAGENKREMLKR